MSKKSIDATSSKNEDKITTPAQKIMCGVIMPIANTPGYESGHWKDVLNILEDALKETKFEAKLVSERIDIGLIHEQIVTNIYENEIVICDVSSKNPNVMFELGMRLAFDKPTIIIKDELTNYSFDIGGILHLEYPSSLRHNKIEKFKNDLSKHVIATHSKSKSEAEYSPFLKGFGRQIIPKSIDKLEVSENQYIIDKLNEITNQLKETTINFNSSQNKSRRTVSRWTRDDEYNPTKTLHENLITYLANTLSIEEINKIADSGSPFMLEVIREGFLSKSNYEVPPDEILKTIKNMVF